MTDPVFNHHYIFLSAYALFLSFLDGKIVARMQNRVGLGSGKREKNPYRIYFL